MHNNLIPTVITDKNGRITTVHRKDAATASSASSIPAPKVAAPPKEDYEVWIDDISALVSKELLNPARNARPDVMDKVNRALSLYSDGALLDLKNTLESYPSTRRALSVMLERNLSEENVHEAAVFFPHIWAVHPSAGWSSVAALHYYEREIPILPNYALADNATKEKCVALINLSAAIDLASDYMMENPLEWHADATVPVIKDKELVKLVLDNPEKAPIVTQFIKERSSIDREAIRELLNADSTALSEGML